MPMNPHRIKRLQEISHSIVVREAVDTYLQCPHVKKLALGTQKEYREELSVFATWCSLYSIKQNKQSKSWQAVPVTDEYPQIYLHQINDQVIYCFVEHLRLTHSSHKRGVDQLSTYTLAGYVRVVKVFLNWCLRDQEYSTHIQANTVQQIENPDVIKAIIEVFSPEQIAALFAACDKEESEHLQLRDRAILSLLFDTGIRVSELVKLTIGNVWFDPKDLRVRVFGKGKKWGEVNFGEQAKRHVQRYIKLYREPTIAYQIKEEHPDYSDRQLKYAIDEKVSQSVVFMSRYAKPLTVSGVEQIFARLAESAGIEGVRCTPHTCRHTFAVMFIRNGGDIYTLSKLLRHSSVATTENYLRSLHQSEARRRGKSLLDNL